MVPETLTPRHGAFSASTRMDRHRIRVLAGFLLLLIAPLPAWARPTPVPGTLVSLDPPPGFMPMDRLPGFEYPARRATILVSELPGSSLDVRRGMTRENLAGRGQTLVTSETVRAAGGTGLLLQVTQWAGGIQFTKWMLVAGDTRRSIVVVGSFPRSLPDLSAPIRRAVLSATWKSSGPGASQEGLTFRVTPSPGLKLAGRMGNLLLFSESGKMQPNDSTEAMLIVGSSYTDRPITNVEAFARSRAAQTTRIGPLRDIQGRAMTQDGLMGYELVARTSDTQSGRELRMYQMILADRTTYYVAQGFTTPQRAPALIAQFRRVLSTFRKVRPTTK
jgi:hypothetical protein